MTANAFAVAVYRPYLTKKVDLKLESVPTVVYACFVLHNFCERNQSYVDEDQVKSQIELNKRNENQNKDMLDPIYSTAMLETA